MEIIKKYKPKHYDTFLPVVNKMLGDNNNLHEWVKNLENRDIIVWLICIEHCEKEMMVFFHEIAILLTLVIRLVCIELDVETINLKNKEIKELIFRLKSVLQTELKFRNNEIKRCNQL
jgi:hypothetical protein